MSIYLDWLDEVRKDDGQWEALTRLDHCVVVAGPGAGKTKVLVLKAAKLLYETVFNPRGIACVTYAHSMAEKLRKQIEGLGVSSESHNVFIGTLHSFLFSNVLTPFGKIYEIPVPDPLRFASDRQQSDIYFETWNKFDYKKQNILPRPERDKEGALSPHLPADFQKYRRTHLNEKDVNGKDETLDMLVKAYEGTLLSLGFVDFDLATKWSVQLVEEQEFVRGSLESKYPWLLVDEYQDLGLALHRIVTSLTEKTNVKLFAIGDPNQCIYDFTGANPNYFLELENNVDFYGQSIRLEGNYRSCPEIINQAEKIPPIPVRQVCNRPLGNGLFRVFASDSQFEKIVDIIKKLEERKGIAPHEILILGRSNAACKDIVNALKKRCPSLPISKSAGQIYDSKKPLLEWIENLAQYSVGFDNVQFHDLLDFWVKLHSTNFSSGREALSFENRLKLFSALEDSKKHLNSALEWLNNFVKIVRLEERFPEYRLQQPDDVDEYYNLRSAFEENGEWHSFDLHSFASIVRKEKQLTVETLHSSKGQQRKAVLIAMAEKLNAMKPEDQISNRRLMYVGMTRAEDILVILHDGRSYLAKSLLK